MALLLRMVVALWHLNLTAHLLRHAVTFLLITGGFLEILDMYPELWLVGAKVNRALLLVTRNRTRFSQWSVIKFYCWLCCQLWLLICCLSSTKMLNSHWSAESRRPSYWWAESRVFLLIDRRKS